MKILSWNVNGIRAVCRKGFLSWFEKTRPEICLLQEVKAQESQIPEELLALKDYELSWHAAQRPGYSGVATLVRKDLPPALNTTKTLGIDAIDQEGRLLIHEFERFTLYNIYYPNGQSGEERLRYKLDFYEKILQRWIHEEKAGKNLIIGGDVNTAHREIDLARPRENRQISGFLPVECAWIDKVLEHGFLDTFRQVNGDRPNEYSWWSYRARARQNNVGWRIDYFFISQSLAGRLKDAFILQEVPGSDHCPVGIDIDL